MVDLRSVYLLEPQVRLVILQRVPMLELLAPIGAAIAWIWHEVLKQRKEKKLQAVSEAERERSYSERLEARLKVREEELEKALVDLMNLRLNYSDPEDVLKSIIESDNGVSWVTRDGILVACSPQFGKTHELNKPFEGIGRSFFWSGYIIGIGYD